MTLSTLEELFCINLEAFSESIIFRPWLQCQNITTDFFTPIHRFQGHILMTTWYIICPMGPGPFLGSPSSGTSMILDVLGAPSSWTAMILGVCPKGILTGSLNSERQQLYFKVLFDHFDPSTPYHNPAEKPRHRWVCVWGLSKMMSQ